jgi:serine/threonine-protein kinase RsbW
MISRAIQLRADFEDLPRLAEWVEAQAPVFAMDARQLYAVQLCLEEVVANLVMHATPGAGPEVAITVRIEADPLRVTVEDDAIPFDPTLVAPAAVPASLEEVSPGGLGLTLVQGFSAWRDYVREAGRNRLVMGFA